MYGPSLTPKFVYRPEDPSYVERIASRYYMRKLFVLDVTRTFIEFFRPIQITAVDMIQNSRSDFRKLTTV